MGSKINEIITGEYNHTGNACVYGDTDSEIGTTIHKTNFGEKQVQDLFNSCTKFWNDIDKEYGYDPNLMVLSYNPITNEPYYDYISYIYRHKVSKDLYEIEDYLGNIVTVTEDHSVMIERNGKLLEMKPKDIKENDILISII